MYRGLVLSTTSICEMAAGIYVSQSNYRISRINSVFQLPRRTIVGERRLNYVFICASVCQGIHREPFCSFDQLLSPHTAICSFVTREILRCFTIISSATLTSRIEKIKDFRR